MADGEVNQAKILGSWKEIAAYLGCNKRTCYRWEKSLGLPVHRLEGGVRSRVFAYKQELDDWLKDRAGISSLESYSYTNEASRHKFFLRRFLPIALPVLAAFALAGFFIIKRARGTAVPVDFRVEKSDLVLLNAKGRELWRYQTGIEDLADEGFYRTRFQKRSKGDRDQTGLPCLIIGNIDAGEAPEVLFSTRTKNEYGRGKLICFDARGSVLWEVTAGREMTFGEKVFSPDYYIDGFEIHDLDHDGDQEILLLADHNPFEPTVLMVIESDGRVRSEYWNSGRISDISFADLSEDGVPEMIISGVNNEYGKGFLAVFDPSRIEGGSPQVLKEYRCSDLKPGKEKYYVLFPRTEVDITENPPMESNCGLVLLNNRRIQVITCVSRIYYELDFGLRILDIRPSTLFLTKYAEYSGSGRIKKPLAPEYWKSLARQALYWNGIEWVSEPSMSSPW